VIDSNIQKGFTLIEVVISMAVLSIIIVAFLNLFSMGLLGIYTAGDKGINYSKAQADVETLIATKESEATGDLEIFFDGERHDIPSGLVRTERVEGISSSSLDVVIPYVPSIVINPQAKSEGTIPPTTVAVVGFNTNFQSGSTGIEILDNLISRQNYNYVGSATSSFSIIKR
jgi:prepilin-type N-terminal cleavage/methylation domain-containing protein